MTAASTLGNLQIEQALINSQSASFPREIQHAKYIFDEREIKISYCRRPIIEKIVDVFLSIIREFVFDFILISAKHSKRLVEPLLGIRPEDTYKNQWKQTSKGLYVLIHGLKGHPHVWKKHRHCLRHQQPDHDVFVPHVVDQGNCTLEKAANPILEKIREYAQKHPQKPICLIGASNGGRIATYLETQLREKSAHTEILVSTIAGVHFGSKMLDRVNHFWLMRKLVGHTDAIRQELSFSSERAKKLLDHVQNPLRPETKRTYVFYGSTEDYMATDLRTTLPRVGSDKTVHYHVFHGYGHSSLVNGVRDHQLTFAQQWMNTR